MKTKNSDLKYIRAKNKVDKEKKFYSHLIIYISVNILITIFKVWNHLDSWESFINEIMTINVLATWALWGVFLLLHFLSFKFGVGWEDRKIEEYMRKELTKEKYK